MVSLCYTCGSCDNECPVNRKTNRLSPRKLVRSYVMRLSPERLYYPEMWYCIRCGRCGAVCPMNIKPFEVISQMQDILLRSLDKEVQNIALLIHGLRKRANKARYLLIKNAFETQPGEEKLGAEEAWEIAGNWMADKEDYVISVSTRPDRQRNEGKFMKYFDFSTNIRRCISCGACANACPVSVESRIFSPMKIFRMIRLGMVEEASRDPGIWMCVDCGQCMRVCPQNVRGLWIMDILKRVAISEGFVKGEAISYWKSTDSDICKIQFENVDRILADIMIGKT